MREITGAHIVGEHTGASGDTHALGFCKEDHIYISNSFIDANGLSEALKFSMCWDIVISDCHLIGGVEDCLDIVRGGNLTIRNCTLETSGRFFTTIKGGVKSVVIANNRFRGKPTEAGIDLGNWTNYDIVPRPKVRDVQIYGNTFENSGYTAIRSLYSEKPVVSGNLGNTRSVHVHPFFVKCFFWARRRGWFGGKVAVDPAELIVTDREKD